MEKEGLLEKYENFCSEKANGVCFSPSQGTISGLSERLKQYTEKLEEFNKVFVDEANTILNEYKGDNKEELRSELLNIGKKYIYQLTAKFKGE